METKVWSFPLPHNQTKFLCPPFSCHQVPATHTWCSTLTTYYPGLPKLKQILREGFHILYHPQFAKTIPPSHCQLLQTTKLLPNPGHPKRIPPLQPYLLHNMPHPHPTQSFTSPNTNLSYSITTLLDCKSSNLMYQLQCKKI